MKRVLYFCLCLFACLGLFACSVQIGEKGEKIGEGTDQMIRVYDANEKKILETKNKEIIDTFGEYVGSTSDDVEGETIFDDMPADAKVAYHFVLTTRAGHEIDLYVYENYNDLLLANIPLVGKLRFPISEKELDWLRNPQGWE